MATVSVSFLIVLLFAGLTASSASLVLKLERMHCSSKRGQLRHIHLSDVDLALRANGISFGIYTARLPVGTPPKYFDLIIDTGSHISWIDCVPCGLCIDETGEPLKRNSFDPRMSSTASAITCSDRICKVALKDSDATCSNNSCSYKLDYRDGSGTAGHFFSDILHFEFEALKGGWAVHHNSTSTVFGCSNERIGNFRTADGILGLGHHDLSIISQLASHTQIRKVFSYCFGSDGIGVLVVDDHIMDPNVVYSPLLPSKFYYNLDLQSISVAEKQLVFDSWAFVSKLGEKGISVDSGTSYTYLPETVYDALINSITTFIYPHANKSLQPGFEFQCYTKEPSIHVDSLFPVVSLNFDGDVSMVLRPLDYITNVTSSEGNAVWCILFRKNLGPFPILGGAILQDKLIIYDYDKKRIGWAKCNCSTIMDFPTTKGTSNSDGLNSSLILVPSFLVFCVLCFL